MVEYDPKFIKECANQLYAQAKTVVPSYFFIGILFGILVFGAISDLLLYDFDFLIVAIGVLIGAFMGLSAGNSKAAELRLRAQELLCQIKQEENTRR